MIFSRSALLYLAAGLLLCAATPRASAQTVITYYNFNDSNLISDPTPNIQVPPAQTSTITVNNLGTTFVAGNSLNAISPDPAGNALRLTDANNGGGNAKTFQFTVNTLGMQNLMLTYATQASNLNFTQTLFYSVNGGLTFTQFSGPVVAPGLTWGLGSFDLSTITTVNNQASVIFQIGLTQSGQEHNQTNDFDNIQLLAKPIPEPSTWVGAALGLASLLVTQRRRLAPLRL